MRGIVDILFVSRCGKYILILRDFWASEWVSTNKRGRTPGWNELHSDKWVELDSWIVE